MRLGSLEEWQNLFAAAHQRKVQYRRRVAAWSPRSKRIRHSPRRFSKAALSTLCALVCRGGGMIGVSRGQITPPVTGSSTRAILVEEGFTEAEIEDLIAEGVAVAES